MSNLCQRLLMFFTFVPLILVLLFVFPEPQHLAFQISVLLLGTGLAFETVQIYGFFSPDSRLPLRRQTALRAVSIALIALIPLGLRLLANFDLVPAEYPLASIILLVFTVFGSIVPLTQKLELSEVHERMRAYLMVLMYPVLGFSCFMTLFTLPDATIVISLLLTMVFGNDTLAYLAGKFLGKHSGHPIKISPNKTVVGFAVGFLSSPLLALVFWAWFPAVFKGSLPAALVIGLLIGTTTIFGDLFESSLKRNSGLKDSGQLIPGRGGLLDSLDSLLFSSPFYLVVFTMIYGIPFWGA